MKKFFRKVIKFLAYTAATVVILLAIAVGLFRLFLPRVPEYQDEIKSRASAAIGMEVEFSGMDARWGLSGPELEFYDAEIISSENGARLLAADEVRVGVGFMRLLFEQAVVVDRLVIRETSIEVREDPDGTYRIQGLPLSEWRSLTRSEPRAEMKNIEIIGDDIELRLIRLGDERPHFFEIPRIGISIDENRIAADADIRLPSDLGKQLSVSATQILSVPADERGWDVIVDAADMNLAGWSELSRSERQFQSGNGDMDLALAYAHGRVQTATVELDFVDVALADDALFDVSGRVEVDVTDNDWLIAANEFVISLDDHQWPESSLRVEASVDAEGKIVMIDARASYLKLDDLQILTPWLDEEQRQTLTGFDPSGTLHNLVATVSDIHSEDPRFNITAELDRVGIAGAESRPSIRGFSGVLRANKAGGRLEIDSSDVNVLAPNYVAEAIQIDTAAGTIIWRNSAEQTTILSDSILLSDTNIQSRSNVQLVLNKDGSSPEIDLESTWSIADLAVAKRFIPHRGLNAKLYDWFQMSLVSGAITRGKTTLRGPLDKFPFDGGEGRLLMEASVRNLDFKYHLEWPAAEQSDMEVILDNARLYTTQNSSVSAGIPVVDANINIPDLRDPVLYIDSFSASTLEDIREFSIQSPISNVFGGQLDRVTVSGDATFTLELMVPLKKERLGEFEFAAGIRSNNGTLAVDGFAPAVSELVGEVAIERDILVSEGLSGRFLGDAINVSLARSEDPQFSIIATALGTVTAERLVSELAPPLQGIVAGSSRYEARLLFPNGKAETPSPFTIRIDSDLNGLGFDLPVPLGKAADDALQISADIRFLDSGKTIETSGSAANGIAWTMAFNKPGDSWDFDRGVVMAGGGDMEPAGSRGLHIRGATGVLRLSDWLDLSKNGENKIGAADRIRSLDLRVGDLYLVGQHLKDHRVSLDRSALDWQVRLDGDDVTGSIIVPYDFQSGRTMVLDMDKLRLPGDENGAGFAGNLDPRNLPAMQLTAREFAFGDRYLGEMKVVLEKTESGLEAVTLTSKDASYSIVGTGRWLADDNDALGSHSYVSASLTSTDVESTMARLSYQPGIDSENMNMTFNLDWSGSPRADFFKVLNGEVQVQFGDGQLKEVEPGAGRIFGLMSIVALPRRLSLDFRDVFSKGFGFDEITGSFRIDNGTTYTCDLSLEGPAADIGIVGEADLANRTYKQTAIVSANVGNTLPIVGAVVAGPQVAAALLIFSQIFKKPLQEVGQVYYAIDGSWDEPAVESTDSEAFVATGELAGCLATGE